MADPDVKNRVETALRTPFSGPRYEGCLTFDVEEPEYQWALREHQAASK
jgi:hypothetical protein